MVPLNGLRKGSGQSLVRRWPQCYNFVSIIKELQKGGCCTTIFRLVKEIRNAVDLLRFCG